MPIQLSGSLVITGSITTTGVITMSGSIASASYSSNSDLLQGTGSVGFTTTASFNAVSSSQQQISASYIALSASYNTFSGSASTRITANSSSIQQISSSQQQISASLLNVIAIGATTGSNSFRADQSITGSLVVSSTITAQTLVVQTVTSSIVYSSGSNNFGNQLANTQTFTGSVNITGSLALAGNITSNGTAVMLGTGTTNYLPKFTGTSTIGDSALQDDGSSVLIGRETFITGTTAYFQVGNGGAGTGKFQIEASSGSAIIGTRDASSIAFRTNLTTKMLLDASGNLGLGVTPSAWSTGKAIDIGSSGAVFGDGINTAYTAGISQNAYLEANVWKYKISSQPTGRYEINGASHAWFSATSGTAGNAITFTQAMTLTAAGRLLLGTTTESTYLLDVNGTGRFNGTSASPLLYLTNTTGGTTTDFTITENVGLIINSYEGASARSIDLRVGGTSALQIASTGAATFSSSVTASSGVYAGDSKFFNSVQLTNSLGGTCQGFLWSDAANTLKIGTGTVAGGNVKMTITSGGNVYVGATTGTYASNGYVFGVRATGGTQTYMSITAPSDTLDSQGLVIGVDSNAASFYMRDAKYMNFFTANTERMRITSAGNTQPGIDNAYSLGVSGTRWSAVWAANGTIQTSDEREKKDIVESDLGLDFVSKLRPVSFKWKIGKNEVTTQIVKDEEGNSILDDEGNEKTESVITPIEGKRTHYGLIAQEVEALLDGKDFGGFIHDEETDIKGLRYDQFVPLLIKSIQEQQAQIEELKALIAAK